MWPYTGEENRWLGRADRGSHTGEPAGSIHPLVSKAKPSRSHLSWRKTLDRLIKAPGSSANENGLPVVAARLKDPLNAIRDSVQALRGNPDLTPDQQAHYLDVVLQENEHLAEMISAMLDQADLTEPRRHA